MLNRGGCGKPLSEFLRVGWRFPFRQMPNDGFLIAARIEDAVGTAAQDLSER